MSEAMSQPPCLGRKGRSHSRLLPVSQTVCSLERARSPFLDCGSFPLPVCSTRSLHTQYWLCSEDNLFCSLFCQWAPPLPGMVSSPSGKIGLEDTLHSRWGSDSAPCLRMGKPGSRASKSPHLRIWIRRSAPYQVPWPERASDLALQISQTTG